jgi:hypothetical protein
VAEEYKTVSYDNVSLCNPGKGLGNFDYFYVIYSIVVGDEHSPGPCVRCFTGSYHLKAGEKQKYEPDSYVLDGFSHNLPPFKKIDILGIYLF